MLSKYWTFRRACLRNMGAQEPLVARADQLSEQLTQGCFALRRLQPLLCLATPAEQQRPALRSDQQRVRSDSSILTTSTATETRHLCQAGSWRNTCRSSGLLPKVQTASRP